MSRTANVSSLDARRQQYAIAQRMAQNSLTLHAAIKDARLTREDLEFLSRMLYMRVLYGQMHLRHDPRDRLKTRAITKLHRAGYFCEPEVRELMIGFRYLEEGPKPYWILELTKRELEREWQ
jgi:hypothetical protein